MAGSVNKAIVVGNLGRDPEVNTTQSGTRVATLNVATSETWKDKTTGERKERTEWHRVVIFAEGLAEVAEKYLRKGSKVYVEGTLATRKWTNQQGAEQYSTEIILRPFNGTLILLDRPDKAPAPSEDSYGTTRSSPPPGGAPDIDDEIPF